MDEYIKCNLCGSDDYIVIAKKLQFGFKGQTVICKNCGLVYINPRWGKDKYDDFYKNQYSKYYGIPQSESSPTFKKRGYEIYEFIKNFINENFNVFEIGCGGGSNLLGIKEKSNCNKIAGLEPGIDASKTANESNVEVLSKSYEHDQIDLKQYDLIILSHVFEHFLNPKKVLEKIRNETKEDILLYIAIPDLSSCHKFKGLGNYWFRIVHTYYFTKETFLNFFEINNWKILKISSQKCELKAILKKSSFNNGKVINNFDTVSKYIENYKRRSRFNFFKSKIINLIYKK